MARRVFYLCLIAALLSFTESLVTLPAQTTAQDTIQGLTQYALTVYSRPDRTSPIVGVLIPQAKVILEARNADTSWVLGHSTDGTTRGWMEQRYLALPVGTNVPALLFSNEEMFVPPPSNLQTVYNTINLSDYPIIPTDMGRAREIYERGRMLGTDRQSVSKVGDCITDNVHFLSPFGIGEYNLGSYAGLQATINQFDTSLAYSSLAAYDGLVTTAVLDPLFANPNACQPGETPLRCEFRAHQPSVAIIMFGAQDLLFTTPEDFDRYLRRIVHETIQAGVIPILSTFPGNLERWDQAIRYNQIVVQIALDYDVPLMNLWRALYGLPNYGLSADGRHLSLPITYSADFTPGNLQRGYPMRNLVTLQTLDAVWRGAMY